MHVQRMLKMRRGLYTGRNFKQNTWKKAKENWGPYLRSSVADPEPLILGVLDRWTPKSMHYRH